MDGAQLANLMAKVRGRLMNREAQEGAYWTPERLAGLHGSVLDHDGVRRLIDLFIKDGVWHFLPAIAGLLGTAARDSDAFARTLEALELKIRNDVVGEPVLKAVLAIGESEPGTALRIAGRLMERDDPGCAYMLIGGAAAKLPGECEALMQKLLASDNARSQETAVRSMVAAYAGPGNGADWDVISALERASESGDARVIDAVMDAFVKFYSIDRQRCVGAMERLACRHYEYARLLVCRLCTRTPFDEGTLLRLLDICSKSFARLPPNDAEIICQALLCPYPDLSAELRKQLGSEYAYMDMRKKLYYALMDLAGGHPEEVMQIVIRHTARDGYVGEGGECVLERLGEKHGAVAVAALLEAPLKDKLRICAPVMIRCVIAGAGSKDALEPVFEAIRSEPHMYAIGLKTLRMVVSDRNAGDASRAPVLEAAEEFLKRLAESKGIDAGRAIKGPAIKGRNARVERCGRLIDAALNHAPPDYDLARRNMERFPALLDLFGKQWIDKEERDGGIHPLLYWLGQRLPSEEEARALTKAEPAETAEQLIRSLDRRRHALGAWPDLDWLDQSLRKIKEAGDDAASFAKRLNNKEQFSSTVSEMRFVVQFLNRCGMEVEPKVGSKRPDLRLEILGRPVYVEIFSPEMPEELRLFSGGRGVANRAPDKMLDKANNQLRELDGRGHPVILAIDIGGSEMLPQFVEECMTGPDVARLLFRNGEAVAWRAGRDADKTLHGRDPGTDVISAVIWYRMQPRINLTEWMEFRIIRNPHARVKLDAPTVEFLEKCLGHRRARSARGRSGTDAGEAP